MYTKGIRTDSCYIRPYLTAGTQDPVRSPLDKPVRAGVVVGPVTTSECPVLYVFTFFSFFFLCSPPPFPLLVLVPARVASDLAHRYRLLDASQSRSTTAFSLQSSAPGGEFKGENFKVRGMKG